MVELSRGSFSTVTALDRRRSPYPWRMRAEGKRRTALRRSKHGHRRRGWADGSIQVEVITKNGAIERIDVLASASRRIGRCLLDKRSKLIVKVRRDVDVEPPGRSPRGRTCRTTRIRAKSAGRATGNPPSAGSRIPVRSSRTLGLFGECGVGKRASPGMRDHSLGFGANACIGNLTYEGRAYPGTPIPSLRGPSATP